uniref:olfactory receptor 2D2-like n=1 Tax=Euleptes europaea TaxID=460621 RepID=UPI002541436F|nr:olfactory receptor 2D2-like [Euleptes europaea]
MGEDNETLPPGEFILTRLSDNPEKRVILFVVFLMVYMTAVLGNLLILSLFLAASHLHTPMYFFLFNFSILEVSYTSCVVPQMLAHLLVERTTISFNRCAAQLYLFLSFGITECLLLTVMSYDRYVAICNPLHYNLTMTKQVCTTMAVASWVGGFLFSSMNSVATLMLSFCGHREIDHFFCEMPAMVRIACAGMHQAQIVVSISCVLTLVFPLLLIFFSYARILHTVLGSHSSVGRHKAFSTCSSHLAVVALFFGTVLSMYLRPHSSSSMGQNKITSVFYIVITPALNPMIYTLRNKEVIRALKKVRCRGREVS